MRKAKTVSGSLSMGRTAVGCLVDFPAWFPDFMGDYKFTGAEPSLFHPFPILSALEVFLLPTESEYETRTEIK